MGNFCDHCTNLSSDQIYYLISQKLLAYQHLSKYCPNYQSMLKLMVYGWENFKQNETYFCLDHTAPKIVNQSQVRKEQKLDKQQNAIVYMKKQYLYFGKIKNLKFQGKGILFSYVNITQNISLRKYEGNFTAGLANDTQAKFIIYKQNNISNKQSQQAIFKDATFQKGFLRKCELHHHNEVYIIKINKMALKNGVQNINARIIFPDKETIYQGDIVRQQLGFYKLQGKGQLIFPNKNYYNGQFRQNKFQGEGIFYFVNGKQYHGFYKNGLKHGKGKFYPQSKTHPDNYLQTNWHQGSPQGSAIMFPAGVTLQFKEGNVLTQHN